MLTLLCKNCGSEFASKQRAKQHCSSSCFSEYRRRPDVLEETKKRREQSNIEKYGVKNPAQSKKVKDKARATCIEKYGAVSPSQNKEIKDAQKKTCIERYGVENPQQNLSIRIKQQNSTLKSLGVKHALQSEDVMAKLKETNLKKYGVENVASNESVKNKKNNTCLEKYGHIHPITTELVKNKQKEKLSEIYYEQIKERSEQSGLILKFKKEEYINCQNYKEYPVECSKCFTKFSDCFTHGYTPRCPTCFPVDSTSIIEQELYTFLTTIIKESDIERYNRKILSGQEIDFYIASMNIAIELNGNYWHSEIAGKKYKNYHIYKTKRCEEAGIQLIHIFEDEWLHKQDIIKNKLIYLLCPAKVSKIYARKCVIQSISNEVCNAFLEKTHIQGKDKSSIKYGAYYNGELVSVITFGKNRIALGNSAKADEYELYRFCSNGSIVGIMSKFISHFIKEYSPKIIITYADRRFSSKEKCGYSKCGFSFVKETSPNYWYMNKKSIQTREHRYKYRKSELKKLLSKYDSTKTEWENMQDNGYDRIWDCGSLRYEMILK